MNCCFCERKITDAEVGKWIRTGTHEDEPTFKPMCKWCHELGVPKSRELFKSSLFKEKPDIYPTMEETTI